MKKSSNLVKAEEMAEEIKEELMYQENKINCKVLEFYFSIGKLIYEEELIKGNAKFLDDWLKILKKKDINIDKELLEKLREFYLKFKNKDSAPFGLKWEDVEALVPNKSEIAKKLYLNTKMLFRKEITIRTHDV